MPGGKVGQGYSYDQRNLLRTGYTIGSVNTLDVDFIYDGDGNRLQQIDHTGSTPITTAYTNDNTGLSQVLVSDDGATTTANLFGLDLIQQDDGTDTRTLLADGLGSVRVQMVGDTIETTTTYEPYGKVLAQSGSSGTVYGYTGEQHDGATGLIYLRARYYAPDLKVFLSRDPFSGLSQVPASQHPYSYAHNNPVNFTDPTGECIWGGIDTLICGGVVIVVVVVYVAGDAISDLLQPLVDPLSRAADDFVRACGEIIFAPPRTQTQTDSRVQDETETQVKPQIIPTPRATQVPYWPDDNGGKDVALGLGEYLGLFVRYLNTTGTVTGNKVYDFRQWQQAGLTTLNARDLNTWPEAFHQATNNADAIHFNLAGIVLPPGVSGILGEVPNINYYIDKFGGGGDFSIANSPYGTITAWELYTIKHDWRRCSKAIFYEDGETPSLPGSSLWREICGP